MNLETLYSKLPICLQNIALHYEASKIKRLRYNDSFFSILTEYKSREELTRSELEIFKNKRLKEYLDTIKKDSIFYSDQEINVEELKSLPILDKEFVKENYNKIITSNNNYEKIINAHTSGTTGSGLKFKTSLKAHQEQFAVWWRYRESHGIKYNTLCGYFGGRRVVPIEQKVPPFFRFVKTTNQLMFSNYHINEKTIKNYVEALNNYKPIWLHGYPSCLSLLAGFMLDQNLKLDYQVKWITTGAENLLSNQILLIEKVFGVKPIQHYGQAEAVANISECPKGHLHVDEDFSYVEFFPINSNRFKIVGTNFTNPVFPLLRYDTGDIAVISGKSCSCGRNGRVVDSIDGRSEDYITLKNGSKVGRLDHIFKDFINIREAQIYQKELGKIEVRIVKNNLYNSTDEKRLKENIKSYLGDIETKVNYVFEIEKTKSNKLKFVISGIDQ